MDKKQTKLKKCLIPPESIESKILLIRGKKVMLDRDLAVLYGATTGNLNKAVKRNIDRFPEDFMFQLNPDETEFLRFQFGSSIKGRGGRRYLPYVFTEQGVAMLSSVLNSERAIHVNIQIIRTFTKLRALMITHKDLKQKIESMENKYDHQFKIIFKTIKKLLDLPEEPKERIGFHTKEREKQ